MDNINKFNGMAENILSTGSLTARDALTDRLIRVSSNQHSQDILCGPDTVCAVFDEASGHFMGLVTIQHITQYPQRIFADLVPRPLTAPLPEDTPLEDLEHILTGDFTASAVSDINGCFLGAVTRASLLTVLLSHHKSIQKTLSNDRQQLSKRLDEVYVASRELLELLANTQNIQSLVQRGIEILATLIEARYGAVGLFDENAYWDTFIYTGISPEQAEGIATLPKGEGLLGIITNDKSVINIPSMAADEHAAGFPNGHPPMSSLLAVPIVNHDRMLGRVYLCDKTGNKPFNADDEHIVKTFANTFALILLQAKEQCQRQLLEKQQSIASKVFEHNQAGIMITDSEGIIVATNPAFTLITGYQFEDVRNKTPRILSSGEHGSAFFQKMWNSIQEHGEWQGEIKNRRKSGELYSEWLKINTVFDNTGAVTHYIATFVDITDRVQYDERIWRLANYDALTELPNRTLAREQIKKAILSAKDSGGKMALLFMDLDHFKPINDSFGHSTGDQLLQSVTQRLLSSIRSHKRGIPLDAMSRQGGDEFTLLLCNLVSAEDAAVIAQRLLDTFQEPFSISGKIFHLSMSVGIAMYPIDAENIDDIIRHADMAMYEAKRAGRNNYKFFDEKMAAHCSETLSLKNDLYRALERGQLQLHYQPRLDIASDRITSFEALMRWYHPERGIIPPLKFIPLLEESPLLEKVDDWLLTTACRQCLEWQIATGRDDLIIAINLSARQFQNPHIVQSIQAVLEDTGLSPQCLEVELTESITIQNTDNTIKVLNELHNLGVRCSLDDFGTGYSSLSYLRDFHLSALKIDKSFVQRISHSEKDKSVIRAIISIAKSLELQVIAEGVETLEQKSFLYAQGCQEYQGYLFSKPLPVEEATHLINTLSNRTIEVSS